MPELPEVASFRKYFEKTALDKQIAFAQVKNPRILRGVSAADLEGQLSGNRFKSTRQHGKYLFAELHAGNWLVMHFGMTGFLEYIENNAAEPAYTRFLIGFAQGGALAYVNPRMLGWIGVCRRPEEVIKARRLGPSALASRLGFEAFRERMSGKKSSIKSALMDQSTLAGIGNIYADEILFHAKIHPETKVHVLDESQLKDIFAKMRKILSTAVKLDADYAGFPKHYLLPNRGKKGACPVCGAKWETVKIGGRTAYFCPRCQKKS
jgi:formamidopyrimidine-DNA glycosylase